MADKPDPFDVEALESAVNDSATRVSTIWISFLIFSLYLLIASTTVTQRQLLLAEPVKLPILNIDLPLWGFFFLAPILFVILHAYVLLQVVLLGRTAAAYNAALARVGLSPEENVSLRQRLANTLFAQIFAGSPREREGWLGWLLKAMAWITLAIAPILILLAFQFSFLAYHSHIATWTHRLLILFELAALFLIWPLALDAQKDFKWPQIGTGLKRTAALAWLLFGWKERQRDEWPWHRQQVAPLATCLLFIIVSFLIATFPGEPHINLLADRPSSTVECEKWFSKRFDHVVLRLTDGFDSEKLAKFIEDTSKRNLSDFDGGRTINLGGRDLNCSNLSLSDFRRADFSGASLIGADLGSADMDGATFANANLQDAFLIGAEFRGASLVGANLQTAILLTAELQRAVLTGTNLQGAFLQLAHLEGALLVSTKLQGAILRGAHLEGATITDAALQAADLNGAQFQGAVIIKSRFQAAELQNADLEGTDIHASQLQGAHLDGAVMQHAKLSNIGTWQAGSPNCSNSLIKNHTSDATIDVKFSDAFGDEDNGTALPATAVSIEKFISDSLANIPNPLQKTLADKMRLALVLNSLQSDKPWSDCQQSSDKVPPQIYDEELASFLQNLICTTTENRMAIAMGVVDGWVDNRWLGYENDRRAIGVQLARGLLGQDVGGCETRMTFNEATMNKLRSAAKITPPADAAK
jgi:uncharacterized protein YjbI with pentapeptide repeats